MTFFDMLVASCSLLLNLPGEYEAKDKPIVRECVQKLRVCMVLTDADKDRIVADQDFGLLLKCIKKTNILKAMEKSSLPE